MWTFSFVFHLQKILKAHWSHVVSSCVSATFFDQRDGARNVMIAETALTRCKASRTKSRPYYLRAHRAAVN